MHKVTVTVKVQDVSECLPRWYLLNCRTFCFRTWYGGAVLWARVSCGKKLFAFSRSRSLKGFIWSKHDSFYSLFWTVDSVATKLDLMIHHHKPECLIKKKWITVFKVKVTVKGQNVSVCPNDIFSRPNILSPNLVLWCTIMSRVHAKRLVCYFRGQGHRKGSYDQNRTVAAISSELLIFFATKLGLIVHDH